VANKCLVVLSGGLDSAVTLALARKDHKSYNTHVVRVDNGSRQSQKEKYAFEMLAEHYDIPNKNRHTASVSAPWWYTHAMFETKTLSLHKEGTGTGNPKLDAPHIVPGRNLVFMSLVASLAMDIEAAQIWVGFDYDPHPGGSATTRALDKSPNFVHYLQKTFDAMGCAAAIHHPLLHYTKEQIVKVGLANKVPFELTWSCYNSMLYACGQCAACQTRLSAFKSLKRKDPVPYHTKAEVERYADYPIP
jgi:7-cyano-7-deazaguanine synthase